MNIKGIDYAWTHVTLPAGCKFVARYYSHDPAKDLSLAEARALKAKGQHLVTVWETSSGRADGGRAAGLADAKWAMAKAAECHQPKGSCIYFAVDFDATVGPKITAYFKAVREVLGAGLGMGEHFTVGAYGGIRVIKALLDAGLIEYGWQTAAWSAGHWDPRAHIRQVAFHPTYDDDVAVHADYGQWRPDAAKPKPKPKPKPAPSPKPKPKPKPAARVVVPKVRPVPTPPPFANGQAPKSALAPVPGGELAKDAAAAWNAFYMEALGRLHVAVLPAGNVSTYRTLAEQKWLWDHVEHAHNPNWVAVPGTSNHGLGLAYDLGSQAMRHAVDVLGAKYGYAKAWSDAPVEWWHIRYRRGVWNGQAPYGPRVIKHGSTGRDVRILKARVYNHQGPAHAHKFRVHDPVMGAAAVAALKDVQRRLGLTADGIAGPSTWHMLITK